MLSRRWIPSVAAAALLHTALFVAAGRVRAPQVRVEAPASPAAPDEVALDLSDLLEPLREAAPEPKADEGSPAPRREASRGAKVAARESTAPKDTGGEAPPGEISPSPAPASSDEGWTFNPSQPVNVTAPGFVARSVADIASGPDSRPPPPSAGRLAEALDARDVELGMGRGGPVLSALELATRDSNVPEGWAMFDVAIDRSGRVSVALSNVSSDQSSWAKVASVAAASVDTAHMRIPPGANGWRVVVKVEARVQYPDGRRPKDLGTKFEATPGKLSSTSMVVEKTPGFTIATQGKVCGAGISVHPLEVLMPITIGGGCDPENAGMPAVRIVSGHIVSEGRL